MGTTYNIYCDESCHIEHDHIPIMLLGGTWCPKDQVKTISKEIRKIKAEHNAKGELKWMKVSNSRLKFYQNLLDYFFRKEGLNFRCLVVARKDNLNHSYFNQNSHDTFYYKMYYSLLLNIVKRPESAFNIYLDIKDTRGSRRIKELRRILHAGLGDQNRETISPPQLVRSHESVLIQLADFLIGAVSYCNRNDIPKNNSAKLAVIQQIKARTGTDLIHTCPPWEEKFNLFIFQPRRLDNEWSS